MRKLAAILVLTALGASLSACAVVDAGGAVIDVAATAVSTTADVTGDVICTVACDDDSR